MRKLFARMKLCCNLRFSDEQHTYGIHDYKFPFKDKVGGIGLLHMPGCSSLFNHPGRLFTPKTATI